MLHLLLQEEMPFVHFLCFATTKVSLHTSFMQKIPRFTQKFQGKQKKLNFV